VKRWIRRILKSLGVAIVAAVLAGATYEQIGRWQDRKRYPQIGRSVDIGGRTLNIYCSGEGAPAVVFDSGRGSPGYSWVYVQRETARFTRACWYDRAGYGWSDFGPYPRTTLEIAIDLRALLRGATVPPPYVLVGHSLGGFNVRVYNSMFPADVAGAVLVDSAHEDEGNRIPRHRGRSHPAYLRRPFAVLARFLNSVGVLRLVRRQPEQEPPPRGISPTEWNTITGLRSQAKMMAATAMECQGQCGEQARSAGGLGDRPLIVLTAGRPVDIPSDPSQAREADEDQQVWIELQGQLARLSSRGRQVIVRDSDHGIPFEAPGAVIEAVREVVTQVRAEHAR